MEGGEWKSEEGRREKVREEEDREEGRGEWREASGRVRRGGAERR